MNAIAGFLVSVFICSLLSTLYEMSNTQPFHCSSLDIIKEPSEKVESVTEEQPGSILCSELFLTSL